jgi:hypothetical protein
MGIERKKEGVIWQTWCQMNHAWKSSLMRSLTVHYGCTYIIAKPNAAGCVGQSDEDIPDVCSSVVLVNICVPTVMQGSGGLVFHVLSNGAVNTSITVILSKTK